MSHLDRPAGRTSRSAPFGSGLAWRLRKGLWNRLAIFKFRSNKPAHIPIPVESARRIVPVPLASISPRIPIYNIVVADHVPADEAQPLKKVFYWFQLLMYRFYPATQAGLPSVDDNPIEALREAYDEGHRRLFSAPRRPPELDSGAPGGNSSSDVLGSLAVKGPFACYLERAPEGGFQWDLRALSNYEHHSGLYPLGVRVLFTVDPATRLVRAERIESALGNHTPSHAEWELASRIALCAASTHLSLVRHFNWVHLAAGGPLAIATRNHLPADHPIRRLLWPHVYGTQYSNDLITEGQMMEGGDFFDIFSLTHRGICALFSASYEAYRISILDPELDARKRGIENASFDTPSQANLEQLFAVLHAHAVRYVHAYYVDDDAIARDAAIRDWLEALEKLIPNGIGDILVSPTTRGGVSRLIGAFIYMATVQHEVVGTGVWNYQLWADRIPIRVYGNGRREPLDIYQRLVNANFNLNVHRASLLQDFSYLALDQKGRDLFKQFLVDLRTLDTDMQSSSASLWKILPGILEANINA